MDSELEKELKERFNEAEREAKIGQKERAQELFSTVIVKCTNYLTLHPQHQASSIHKLLALSFNNRGHLRYLRVEFDAAVDDYTSAIQHQSGLAVAHYSRGLIHYRLGRRDEARLDQETAVRLKPGFVSAEECLQQILTDLRTQTASNDND